MPQALQALQHGFEVCRASQINYLVPILSTSLGYAYALGLMLTITVVGYWYFKRKDWL